VTVDAHFGKWRPATCILYCQKYYEQIPCSLVLDAPRNPYTIMWGPDDTPLKSASPPPPSPLFFFSPKEILDGDGGTEDSRYRLCQDEPVSALEPDFLPLFFYDVPHPRRSFAIRNRQLPLDVTIGSLFPLSFFPDLPPSWNSKIPGVSPCRGQRDILGLVGPFFFFFRPRLRPVRWRSPYRSRRRKDPNELKAPDFLLSFFSFGSWTQLGLCRRPVANEQE